jgi:hypothetical protein
VRGDPATLGNGVEIINDVPQTGSAGHALSANQTRVSVDITLESQDDCVQFIAFIDEAGTTGKSLSVDGFEIVDVDRSDYPLVVGGDSLSVIASANARYNRNQNFERSVSFDSVIAITPFNYRSQYIHDEYVTGVLGSRNPTFWFDQNDLSDMGYLNFSIGDLSLTYEEGIESQSIQANISSPQSVEIVTSTLSITTFNYASTDGVNDEMVINFSTPIDISSVSVDHRGHESSGPFTSGPLGISFNSGSIAEGGFGVGSLGSGSYSNSNAWVTTEVVQTITTLNSITVGFADTGSPTYISRDYSNLVVKDTLGNIIVNLPLNEQATGSLDGVTAIDSSGNSYDGTYTGCTGGSYTP